MNLKKGYRLASIDERIKLNPHNYCWLIRDYGDTAKHCPGTRVPGSFFCAEHADLDDDLEPKKAEPKPMPNEVVDVRNMIKPLPGDGEARLAKMWDDAYREAYQNEARQRAQAIPLPPEFVSGTEIKIQEEQ